MRFVSWAAVSSRPQAEKESLPDQRRLNHEFVANLSRHYPGYTGAIIADLQVIGSRSIVELSTAAETYPDAYGELLRLVRAGAVDAIVCRSRDRLGRTDALSITVERFCLQHGVIVVPRQSLPTTLDIKTLRDSEGAGLTAAVEGYLTGSAVRRLVNEHARGMTARVSVEKRFPSHLPYGYIYRFTPDGQPTVQIDTEAGAAIQEAIRLYLTHRNYREIAEALNAGGYRPARGAAWTPDMAKHIVANVDAYAGYISLNRRSQTGRTPVQVRGDHAAIISERDRQDVLSLRATRQQARIGRGSVFSGVVVCTACGKTLSSQVQYYQSGSERIAYRRLRCTHCRPQHSIAEQEIEAVLIAAIDQLTQSGDLSAFSEQARQTLLENAPDVGERQRVLDQALALIAQKQQRLLNLYVERDDLAPELFGAEMERLKREAINLQAQLDALRTQVGAVADAESIAARLREVQSIGRYLIEHRAADLRGAQMWLAQVVRVEVKPTAGSTEITAVRWLV
ncbi:MAG: recombinase family protein [Vampirovibrionales bacterium]|nr:recombinase family protein [Vampirovibrionales bacterium]